MSNKSNILALLVAYIISIVLAIALATYAWNAVLCVHWNLPVLTWKELTVLYFAIRLFFCPAISIGNKK